MDFLKQNKTVILAIGGIGLALFVYLRYAGGSEAPLLSTSEQDSPVTQELVAALRSLTTITLDTSIFQDKVFLTLSDFGVTIPSMQAGRRNPFAPVGGAPAATGAGAPARR